MIIQENTYQIYPSSGIYYILATENLTVTIYDYEDNHYRDTKFIFKKKAR